MMMIRGGTRRVLIHNTIIVATERTRYKHTVRFKSTAAATDADVSTYAFSEHANTTKKSIPNFHDTKTAYASKSTPELLRSYLVFQACEHPFLVSNARQLLHISNHILGKGMTQRIMKQSFFAHFCAGESSGDIQPTIETLRKHGVGGILDYAAEAEADTCSGGNRVNSSSSNQPARVYDYKCEVECDRHLDVFRSCIHAVRDVTPDGFAAVKLTALGNPLLLERLSTAIVEMKRMFAKLDCNGDGVVDWDEFDRGYRLYFNDADEMVPEYINRLDPSSTGAIDYISWSRYITFRDLPKLTASCRDIGPLALAAPSREEIELLDNMTRRVEAVAEEAANCGVRLLIDAEQTYMQPGIDNLTVNLQQKYNCRETQERPIIFNTYQCYLKDMPERMMTDLKRSEQLAYHFAAKLVRGAYMHGERVRAKEMGYPSPIHDTIEDTHKCYDESVEYILRHRLEHNSKSEVLLGSHNQPSIEKAIRLMNELDMSAGSDQGIVHFAQLLGMSDHLTFGLGKQGYRAYKYVPYGKVDEVMPYLLRRAEENSTLLGSSNKEKEMLGREIKRRIFG
mmetsp:Transcript_12829/g.19453  ORF Transcript_12829/g.19453 Transcript_12829/m.19453 type:complete len:566 (-) Transcript_12829:30-1727(-)